MKTMFWLDDPNPDWRWASTECWTEGKGNRPAACPTCGCTDAWFATAAHGGRLLKEVFEDVAAQMFGAPKKETKH